MKTNAWTNGRLSVPRNLEIISQSSQHPLEINHWNMNFHLQSITQSRWRIWVMDAALGWCHLIAPPSLITSQPPAKLRIMKGLEWQLTPGISSLISKHGCLQYFPPWEILRRFRDTTNSLSSVTNDPRPGTEYTDNYLLSSGFWPRVKLKNYHHPVRPLSFKRFQLLIVRAQSVDKRDGESKNLGIN